MDVLIWIIAIILGFSIAFATTITKLIQSNDLGNSESNIKELDGSVSVLMKSNAVNKNHPL